MSPRDVADEIKDPHLQRWAWEVSKQIEAARDDLAALRERLDDHIETRQKENQDLLIRITAIETSTAVEKRMNSKWAMAVWTGLGALATAAAFLFEKFLAGRKP